MCIYIYTYIYIYICTHVYVYVYIYFCRRQGSSYASDDCSSLIDYQLCSAALGCQADTECCRGPRVIILER